MGKYFNIILAITMVFATTGISISKHYCGNILMETSLGNKAESCMPGMDMPYDCCNDETESIILDDDFQLSQFNFHLDPTWVPLAHIEQVLPAAEAKISTSFTNTFDTGPPVPVGPVYIRIQQFLL